MRQAGSIEVRGAVSLELPSGYVPPTIDYATLTDEEVADRMRVVAFVDGLEYTEVHPDVAKVTIARQKNAAKKKMFVDSKDPRKTYDPDVSVTPVSLNLSPLGASPANRDDTRWHEQSWTPFGRGASSPRPDLPRTVIGGDERIWVDSIGQTFARPTVKLVGGDWWANYSSLSSGCSATMIGNDTAMTAAHCLYNRQAQVYTYPLSWGVDTIRWRAAGSGGAYTIQTYYPLSSYGWGCFDFYIPGGYTLPYGGADVDDFAVIEFKCGYHPGATTGYMPVGIGDDVQVDISYGYIFGFDFEQPWVPNPQAGWEYPPGSMVRREGSIFVKEDDPLMLKTYLDTRGGSSGAGFLKNLFWWTHGNPNYYWSGVNVFQRTGPSYNWGRRSDWLVWDFIRARTNEWY